jgi:hypothetical protein
MRYELLLIALLGLALSGCDGELADAKGSDCDVPAAKALEAQGQVAQAVGASLHRVVFIDQEEACGCTRERIDATWEALDAALIDRPEIMVERVFGDTQEDQAAPYIAMKALVVAPGIYFFDKQDTLLEMMQGKLTAEELAVAVK